MEDRQPTAEPLIRVRRAREGDLDRVVAIHASAFPDARNREARRRNFTDNARGDLSDLFVALLGSTVVGHAFLFQMATWIGGRRIAVGGVASVGVATEARGQGVARVLMHALARETAARGAPLCLLYPFRHRFYRRLGYGLVSEMRRLRIAPSAFPVGATESRIVAIGDPLGTAAVQRCYARVAPRATGLLERNAAVWRGLLGLDARHLVAVTGFGGEVEGYLLFQYLGPPDTAGSELDVVELVADTDRARLALYGFIHGQRDQVCGVRLVVDRDDPVLAVLDEPRAPGSQTIRGLVATAGEVGAGAMVKLVDVEGALAARGWSSDGALALRIWDPEGDLSCAVDVRDGVATIGVDRGGPWIRTDRATAAQLYAGFLRPSSAVRLGVATVDTPETVHLADRLFMTATPFFPLDVF